jgi:hypothetical protein
VRHSGPFSEARAHQKKALSLNRGGKGSDLDIKPLCVKTGFDLRIAAVKALSHFFFASRCVKLLVGRDPTIERPTLELTGEVFSTYPHVERRLVMIPPQSSKSRPSLFVLDSGAEYLVLFGDNRANLDGLGFDLKLGYHAGLKRTFAVLNLGGTALRDLPVVVANPPPADKFRIENGLLPTRYFQSIYFNNSRDFVIFNPRFRAK